MELSYDYKSNKPATRRAKTIFSVLASANRIDILKILNSKGSLTYSELKEYAGFKSKKESGKFAYHLRKLTRQSLISLNKGEKKYAITNLGKLVLNLVRQIEERSILESGKVYIRTLDKFQEFNTHKIMQILIRDADMPPDIANKIAEEVESKIFKLGLSYLTDPIVNEIIGNTLLEHGYEEYKARLSRVGIASSALSNLLSNNIYDLTNILSNNILSEFMLFSYLPKDVADQHIEGNIHIATGLRSIMPDTVFIDAHNMDSYSLISLIESLSKEVSKEIVLDTELDLPSKEIARLFNLLSSFLSSTLLSFNAKDANIIDGYKQYIENVQTPKIGLITESFDMLDEILELGGIVSIGKGRSLFGIKQRNPIDIVVHSVSINLPRIAYESNKDEMYFRAKLAMMLEPALEAVRLKEQMITRFINDGFLPTLNTFDENTLRISLNLIDPYTSINKILGYDNTLEIIEKTIDTANSIIKEKVSSSIGLSIIHDECTSRLFMLDLERHGKSMNIDGYKKGMIIDASLLGEYAKIDERLDGSSIFLDLDSNNVDISESLSFIPIMQVYLCNKCKKKSRDVICKSCNTTSIPINNFNL